MKKVFGVPVFLSSAAKLQMQRREQGVWISLLLLCVEVEVDEVLAGVVEEDLYGGEPLYPLVCWIVSAGPQPRQLAQVRHRAVRVLSAIKRTKL